MQRSSPQVIDLNPNHYEENHLLDKETSNFIRNTELAKYAEISKDSVYTLNNHEITFTETVYRYSNKQGKICYAILGNFIGKGGNGDVYEVKGMLVPMEDGRFLLKRPPKEENQKYVIKKFNKGESDEKNSANAKAEVGKSSSIKHLRVKTNNADSPSSPNIIMMRKFKGQDLYYSNAKVSTNQDTDFDTAIEKMISLINTVIQQVQNYDVIHHDLKLKNVIFNPEKNKMTVIDYGSSSKTQNMNKSEEDQVKVTVEGTPCYMSPEKMKNLVNMEQNEKDKKQNMKNSINKDYVAVDEKSDSWAVGWMCAELLGMPQKQSDEYGKYNHNDPQINYEHLLAWQKHHASYDTGDLVVNFGEIERDDKINVINAINSLLKFDQKDRATLSQALDKLECLRLERLQRNNKKNTQNIDQAHELAIKYRNAFNKAEKEKNVGEIKEQLLKLLKDIQLNKINLDTEDLFRKTFLSPLGIKSFMGCRNNEELKNKISDIMLVINPSPNIYYNNTVTSIEEELKGNYTNLQKNSFLYDKILIGLSTDKVPDIDKYVTNVDAYARIKRKIDFRKNKLTALSRLIAANNADNSDSLHVLLKEIEAFYTQNQLDVKESIRTKIKDLNPTDLQAVIQLFPIKCFKNTKLIDEEIKQKLITIFDTDYNNLKKVSENLKACNTYKKHLIDSIIKELQSNQSNIHTLVDDYKSSLTTEKTENTQISQRIEEGLAKIVAIEKMSETLESDKSHQGKIESFTQCLKENKDILTKRRDRALITFLKGVSVVAASIFGVGIGGYFAYHRFFGKHASQGKEFFNDIFEKNNLTKR